MDNTFPKLLRKLSKENKITKQQAKTIRGQFFSGNIEGAEKGLKKLLNKSNKVTTG